MTDIARIQVELGGWNGAPGLNTWSLTGGPAGDGFTASDIEAASIEINDIYEAMKGNLVDGATWRGIQEVKVYNDETGDLSRIENPDMSGLQGWAGASTGNDLSRATQWVMKLQTDQIHRNRLIRGRHFLGPINRGAMDSDGTVDDVKAAAVASSYAALLSGIGMRLAVWSQPTAAGASDGGYGDVVAVSYKSLPGVLRSRRD